MKGGKKTQTSTSETSPWKPAAKVLKRTALPLAQQWGQTPQQYTGPSYIGQTPLQQEALAQQTGYYQGAGQTGVVDPAMSAWQQSLDPAAFLTAPGAMNPLDLYAKQIGRNLEENIRPGYAMGQIQAGQHGGYSSERAQNERLAERGASEAIADYGGNLFSSLYNQGLQARQNAIGQAPGMFGLGAAPGQQLYNLGGIQRGELQQQQAMENARREFEQSDPLRRAQQVMGVAGPAAQLGGTSTQTQTARQNASPLGTALGLGMTGLGMMGGGGPMAAMGGLGGLGGFGAPGMGMSPAGMGMMRNPYLMNSLGY